MFRLRLFIFASATIIVCGGACTKADSANGPKPGVSEVEGTDSSEKTKNVGGACGEELPCLLKAARSCSKAVGNQTTSVNMMGMKQSQTWRTVIHGSVDGGCSFTRTLTDLEVTLGEGAKKLLDAQGTSAGQFAELKSRGLEAARRSGKDVLTCVMDSEEFAAAIESEAKGRFSSKTWEKCRRPNAKCPEVGVLAEGCRIGACENGALSISCGTAETGLHLCRLEGEVITQAAIGCKEGSIVFSLGK